MYLQWRSSDVYNTVSSKKWKNQQLIQELELTNTQLQSKLQETQKFISKKNSAFAIPTYNGGLSQQQVNMLPIQQKSEQQQQINAIPQAQPSKVYVNSKKSLSIPQNQLYEYYPQHAQIVDSLNEVKTIGKNILYQSPAKRPQSQKSDKQSDSKSYYERQSNTSFNQDVGGSPQKPRSKKVRKSVDSQVTQSKILRHVQNQKNNDKILRFDQIQQQYQQISVPKMENYRRNQASAQEDKFMISELQLQNHALKEEFEVQRHNYEQTINVLNQKLSECEIKEKNSQKEKHITELVQHKKIIPKENALIITDKLHKYTKSKNKIYYSISDWILENHNKGQWEQSISQNLKQAWKVQKQK